MARKTKDRKLRIKYAVLGDGRTEQFYLKHLKEIKGYGYAIKPSLFNRLTIEEAEGTIDDLRSGGANKIIYLTDYDTIINQHKKRKFNELRKKYIKLPEVMICETMPSIEFWFLLHYHYTTKAFRNAAEAEQALRKHIPDYAKGKDSFLKNCKWVEQLISNGKMEQALNFAQKIMDKKSKESIGAHFPYTKLHRAIKEFEQFKNGVRKK